MRFIRFNTLYEYLATQLSNYRALSLQKAGVIYRLAGIKETAHGRSTIVVQHIGQSKFLEYTPQALAANDHMLEGFSKRDVRTIIFFACEQLHRPRFKILLQEFCGKVNRMIFRLHRLGSHETLDKTAAEISLDKNLINSLSQEDVQSISYIAGYEHAQIDRDGDG